MKKLEPNEHLIIVTDEELLAIEQILSPAETPVVEVFEGIPASAPSIPSGVIHYGFDSAQDLTNPRGGTTPTYNAGTGQWNSDAGSGSVWGERNLTMTPMTGSWDSGSYIRHTYNGTTGQNDDGIWLATSSIATALNLYGQYCYAIVVRKGSAWDSASDPAGATTPKIGMPRVSRDGSPIHGEGPVIYDQPGCSDTYTICGIGSAPSDSGFGPEASFDGYDGGDYPNANCGHAFQWGSHYDEWIWIRVCHIMGDGVYLSAWNQSNSIAWESYPGIPVRTGPYRWEFVGSANAASTYLVALRHVAYTSLVGSNSANAYYDVSDVYFCRTWDELHPSNYGFFT